MLIRPKQVNRRIRKMGFVFLGSIYLLVLLGIPFAIGETKCRNPIIFNFGDSNSDTGGLLAGLGFPIDLPNGRTFFHRSTGRLCDGRLVIDFLCESLKSRYLSPYLESVGSNFRNGVNFAIIGAATQPRFVPFSLDIQVLQFLRFRARSLEITKEGRFLIDDEGFKNALYSIDIGQNDLADAFSANLTYQKVIEKIPSILEEIKSAIKTMYQLGGKNFWIHNTGPLGCLPQKLSLFGGGSADFDRYGCLRSFNDAAKAFNYGLNSLCDELRSELKNATIAYVDIFSINHISLIRYRIWANMVESARREVFNGIHHRYLSKTFQQDMTGTPKPSGILVFRTYLTGFEKPLMACCGAGGPPYNYDINRKCAQTGFTVCKEGLKYVSWDGVHYSEAANAIVASKIISTLYSHPQIRFDSFCHA